MKNIKLSIIALAVTVLPVMGHAQSAAETELIKSKALWFNSNNAAGLSVTPLSNYNEVSVNYLLENGNFKMQQKGDKESNLRFNTNGAVKLGGVSLWGNFSYDNHTANESRFNTNLFDPFRDMPFYIADTVSSEWKRQSYTLNLKAASPILWNTVGAGLEVDYISNTGAKQNDPRSTTYHYLISVRPGFIFRLNEKHYLGLNIVYENGFERDVPTISGQINQTVFVMRGLGNYTPGVVGGASLATFYYKSNKIGGAFQYGFTGKFSGLLDVKYHYKAEDVFQQPTKPQRMGSVAQNVIDGNLQLMLSGVYTHKLTARYLDKNTDGIEFIQVANDDAENQFWLTMGKFIKSNYRYKAATLNYDIFKGRDNEYSWRAGVRGEYSDRFDEYYLPNSTLAAENLYGELYFKKNFLLSTRSKFLTGVNVGYNKNLDGHYLYTGEDANSPLVTELFYKDMKYLTSNYMRLGAELNFSTMVSQKMAFFVKGEVQWMKAASYFDNRVHATFSVGLMF